MDHTYLRYECADSFGLTTVSSSSKAPPSNTILAFLPVDGGNGNPLLLTTAGSHCVGFNLKSGLPVLKLGHREQLTGGVGTGRALNSDQVVCLDTIGYNHEAPYRIATGWVDGAVRVFDVSRKELAGGKPLGVVHSLLVDEHTGDDDDFVGREPLLLNGHTQSPVRTVRFDPHNVSRLASGGSDGTVILWDVMAETGLFRLLGHRGGITQIMFLHLTGFDGLVTSSLDGLVKIWDLKGQCCTQTIANHRGEVWGAACMRVTPYDDESDRWRLIVGGYDGQARVWSVQPPKRSVTDNGVDSTTVNTEETSLAARGDKDDISFFMGRLLAPPNVVTSAEKIVCVKYHPTGKYLGILQANSKTVDIYMIRSMKESLKKKQRRLRRRQEKEKKKSEVLKSESTKGKRGLLDDPESSEDEGNIGNGVEDENLDPELIKASDEFEHIVTVRASHKVSSFAFFPSSGKGELTRVVCALSTNALEAHSVTRKKTESSSSIVVADKVGTVDMYGHPTGIRALALSSDDRVACSVSKSAVKIWNVGSRSCIQSFAPTVKTSKVNSSFYGLCAAFLPGNTHIIVGTREGHLLLIDIAAGDVVYCEESAHEGAIWSLDILRPTSSDPTVAIVSGSADKTVKFWDIESQDETDESSDPMVVHTRTLQMADDIVAVRFSNAIDRSKLLVFVCTLDCTIKVFFNDSLKLFLSLYGHKLPVLAVDASDDDVILASSGADKTVKIFGLDFGDTHRTLHGHEDSVTDLKFVKRSHNFFTASKDGSVRYWDGDRFVQILLLNGHFAEVNSLVVSRTGAFVLSGGMDRQIRVWERTRDLVFLDEERERNLERMFDTVNNRDEGGTANILDRKRSDGDDDDDSVRDDQPQSEAAVKRSVMSVAAGDRIMEALELADNEKKEIATFRKTHGTDQVRQPNPLMLNLDPAQYILWVLTTIKSAEVEQSLLVLPIAHVERLIYYIILLLRSGKGVELCSKVAIFLMKAHQNQVITNSSLATPVRELRRLIRQRLEESRDIVGYNLAAMKLINRIAHERQQALAPIEQAAVDIWAGMGLGSDVAAALQSRGKMKRA